MKDQTQPITTVTGERVALGPIRRDHIPLYQQWMNQLETTRFLRMGVYSFENEEDWYEKMARSETLDYLTIYGYPDLRPIGGTNLFKIDHANRTAELGIMIGDPASRGKGLGTEAVKLMCDYGFNALGLNNIILMTFEWNIAGQKAYEKAGFKEIGRRRQARWFAGRYWDDIYYDLLASEFESPVVRNIILDGINLPENDNGASQ